jgi:hypothetical protein
VWRDTKISKNSLNRQIKEGFLELWKNQMKQYSEGKLRTYTTFKEHFGFENYLSVISNFEHRRCLTKNFLEDLIVENCYTIEILF